MLERWEPSWPRQKEHHRYDITIRPAPAGRPLRPLLLARPPSIPSAQPTDATDLKYLESTGVLIDKLSRRVSEESPPSDQDNLCFYLNLPSCVHKRFYETA